ncbi:MAG: TRAP transporter substrate-binding protein DctP [Pseudomonadota bacterium]|jgi:TRAP-type C4-dicarboxylate transport system substrate-binding protein|nr:TRAP transporter substrate-binding protein DctP [Pseudomonadota bacterium]
MKKSNVFTAFTVVTTAVAFALTASAATIKVTTCVSKMDDQVQTYFSDFHNPVHKADNGIKLRYLGGPEVTPRKKQGPALQRGLVDLIHCPSSYYAGMVPEARLLLLSNQGPKALRKAGTYKLLQKAWAKGLNAHIVGWPHWGKGDVQEGPMFHVYLKRKPKLSKKTGIDFDGRKIRSTAAYNPFMKAMNAIPIVISAGDVYTSLERGLVEGFAWPEGGIAKRGWPKFVKYRYGPGFWRSSTMVVMNLQKWKSLSQKDKDTMTAAGIQYEATSGATLRGRADIDNAKVFKAGVQQVNLKGEYAKAYLSTISGAVSKYVKNKIGSKLTVPFDTLWPALYK